MPEPKNNPAREFGADVIRIVACLMVLTLHFFLRNGFYYREMRDFWGILAIAVRTLSLCCIPLFVMLTGYLKCRKPFSVKYYRSILPILTSYLIISLLHLAFRILILKESHTVSEWFLEFCDCKLSTYGWYVGMYAGLFLLTPLLNLVWTGCPTKRAHLGVVLTVVTYALFLTAYLLKRVGARQMSRRS